MIASHGFTSARVFLLADGASEADLKSGFAISGQAENKLRGFARAHDLQYDEFWRSALIKERVRLAGSGGEILKANLPLVTDEYKRILKHEIETINPTVIVPLSEIGFRCVSGQEGIRKFRGSILASLPEYGQRRVIPILGVHPYLYEDPSFEFISRLDFGKVKRHEFNTEPVKEIGQTWIAQTPGQVRGFFNRNTDAKFVVFDIETFANIPTCISFCFNGLESCCVPILDYRISEDDRVLMLQAVGEILRSPIPKVNQNIKFDWKRLERIGLTVNNVIGDTMLAANCLYCEFPKNLGFLTSIYTDMPYFKDEGKDYDPTTYDRNKLYIYNAKDSLATHQVYSQQLDELQETGTGRVYQLGITILPIYKRMEERGLRVSESIRQSLLAKYTNLYEIYKTKLTALLGREANPLSSVVMQKIVYDELGYKPIRGTKTSKKTGKPSADEESIEMLLWAGEATSHRAREILRTIVDCRKLHKVVELLECQLRPDGHFAYEFNLAGTVNGRTSSSEASDYYIYNDKGKLKLANIGHGIQNIGKHGFTVDGETYGRDIRSMFVPHAGYIFVEVDLSQAEARVDAVLAGDFHMLDVFDGPIGIHKLTGSWVYDCDPSEIKKNVLVTNPNGVGEDRYHVAKTVRHAGERNMQEDRLMMMIYQPLSDCTRILRTFHNNQPNIRGVFHKEVTECIMKARLLVAPNGRRRQFFGRIDQHTINEGISMLPQAIVTDYLKDALPKVFTSEAPWHPLVEAHDGLLAEIPIGMEEEYARLFKKEVEIPISFVNCSLSRDFNLTIPSEASVGDSWYDMSDLKI